MPDAGQVFGNPEVSKLDTAITLLKITIKLGDGNQMMTQGLTCYFAILRAFKEKYRCFKNTLCRGAKVYAESKDRLP